MAINIDQTLQCWLVSHRRRPTLSLHETNAIGSAKPPIYSSHASSWSICDGNSRSLRNCPSKPCKFSLLGDHPRRAAADTLSTHAQIICIERGPMNLCHRTVTDTIKPSVIIRRTPDTPWNRPDWSWLRILPARHGWKSHRTWVNDDLLKE